MNPPFPGGYGRMTGSWCPPVSGPARSSFLSFIPPQKKFRSVWLAATSSESPEFQRILFAFEFWIEWVKRKVGIRPFLCWRSSLMNLNAFKGKVLRDAGLTGSSSWISSSLHEQSKMIVRREESHPFYNHLCYLYKKGKRRDKGGKQGLKFGYKIKWNWKKKKIRLYLCVQYS